MCFSLLQPLFGVMNEVLENTTDIVLHVFDYGVRRIFMKDPFPIKDFIGQDYAFFALEECDGCTCVDSVPEGWNGERLAADTCILASSTQSFPLTLFFCELSPEKPFSVHDLVVEGEWRISDVKSLFDNCSLSLPYPNMPVRRVVFESWLNSSFVHVVRTAIKDNADEAIIDAPDKALKWWQDTMTECMAQFGIELKVTSCRFEARNFVRSRIQKQRIDDFLKLDNERAIVVNAYLRKQQVLAQTFDEVKKVNSDESLSPEIKIRKLDEIERTRCRDLLGASIKLQNSRMNWTKTVIGHEIAVYRIASRSFELKAAMSKLYESERDHKKIMSYYTQSQKALGRMARISEPILSALGGEDRTLAHQSAERLTSSEFAFGADDLFALEYDVLPQVAVQFFRRKNKADGQAGIVKNLNRSNARDVATVAAKIIRINTPMRFEFFSERSGFVTILNIGTSGCVSVQVPNFFVSQEMARVIGDTNYTIPGSELLPLDKLLLNGLDYIESGPPGWEHLSVIISDSPLVSEDILARASATDPFVRLSDAEFEDLCLEMGAMPSPTWTANLMSFLVLAAT